MQQHTDIRQKEEEKMEDISKTTNKELMTMARESLTGAWGLAIGASIICYIILNVPGRIDGYLGLVTCIIAGPMSLGMTIFFLSISREQNPEISQLFDGFKNFGTSIAAYYLMILFLCLWYFLLIIPGIIASLSYSMTWYIIADDDSIGPLEAIRKSKEIMKGNKIKLFCLQCRFIGWLILCLFTLGIGFLWIWPYANVSIAKFYDDIK
ncbi:MAG: DUF975 family protein [Candidatus Electrothrix sp. YB6]